LDGAGVAVGPGVGVAPWPPLCRLFTRIGPVAPIDSSPGAATAPVNAVTRRLHNPSGKEVGSTWPRTPLAAGCVMSVVRGIQAAFWGAE